MKFENVTGIPIIVTTKVFQNRRHKRRRINKKWRKRYGFTVVEYQEQPFFYEGALYCRESDFEKIKQYLQNNEREERE